MARVTKEEARAAARRLKARSRDFQTLETYLAQEAGIDKTAAGDDPYATYRKIGRQDQHRSLTDLINKKKGTST